MLDASETQTQTQTQAPEIPVAEALSEHDIFLVHGIGENTDVGGASLLLTEHASFRTKLEVCLAFEPHLSTSTLRPGANEGAWSTQGLLIVGGKITGAHRGDGGTVARGLHKRDSQRGDLKEYIQDAIYNRQNYNELTVDAPRFAGLYYQRQLGEEALPATLVQAHRELGLPVYVLAEDGLHEATVVDEKGMYELGKLVTPDELAPIDSSGFDPAKLRQELLEKGVFKLAGQERQLVTASEWGRVAYRLEYAESHDTDPIIETIATYQTGISIMSRLVLKEAGLVQESTQYGGLGGSNKPVTREKTDSETSFQLRFMNLPSSELIGRDRFFSLLDQVNSILDQSMDREQRADYLQFVNEVIDTLKQAIGDKVSEAGQDYLSKVGFHLFGFAAEAERGGDHGRAKQARAMAERLVSDTVYQDVIERRRTAAGGFRLTEEDIETA